MNLDRSIKLAVAVLAAASTFVLGAASAHASEICGDVNDSGGLSTSDALLVLRASVGQNVELICEAGPLPSTFGHTTEFVATDTFGENFLLGIPVEVDRPATITHFGVLARSAGQKVRFALYTDSQGEPDDLVIGSGAATLSEGIVEVAVPATHLEPGTYWLLALYDKEATVGSDFSGEVPVRFYGMSFEDPFPSELGQTTGYTGDRFNYYIKVLI